MLGKTKIKYIQSLGQKKFRQQEGLFIAEGPKLVKELLEEKPSSVADVFGLKDWISDNRKILSGVPVTEITEQELEKISQLSTQNNVRAWVRQFETGGTIITKGKFTLALDDIQDPGNLGTIIRIADWFGLKQVVCSNHSADVYNPKVVQATMGSIARVKVFYTDLEKWMAAETDVRIYATSLDGRDITTMKRMEEGIVVIGNESKGISSQIMQLANVKITIPQKGKAESLNAAVAAGIILSHLV